MLVHSSNGCPAATIDARTDRHTASLLHWLVLGTAGLIALILAVSHAASVGAAAPTAYDTTICINYFTCYNSNSGAVVSNPNGSVPAYLTPSVNSAYPANSVLSTYFDPRYGLVSVVTDQYGNLIDVNAATGQRIFPVYLDYNVGFGAGYVNPAFINGNFVGTFPNGFFNNGCPVGNFTCLGVNNGCAVGNFSCLGFNPAFGFPFGTGVVNPNYTVVAPSGNPIVLGPPYRVKEVTPPTVATSAPVSAPAASAPVAAPAAVPAPAAPVAGYATALNTSSAPAAAPAAAPGGSNVHVLSAPAATAPAATRDLDDHR
ncbi:MAG TPA: hypothetical protein VIG44_14260 [Thermomicrobiales bacterium]